MELCIVSYGMQSPTGTNASMSIANVLAGIPRKCMSKKIVDTKLKPVVLGIAEYLNQDYKINDRIVDLMDPALEEALEVLDGKKGVSLKLLLGLPKTRPGLDITLIHKLEKSINSTRDKLGMSFTSEFIREDHDSGLISISKTREILKAGEAEFCLVGGVDSFAHQATIDWLESEKQLKCSSNSKGFVPGEAAAFCLLCQESTALKYELPILAKVLSAATAEEPSVSQETIPNAGKGLSQAIGGVLESLPENELIKETFCTLKGIRHEAMEFSFTVMASGLLMEKAGDFTSFSQFWGDIGAASGPALIGYAIEKKILGFSEAGNNLIFTISPGCSRSAALVKVL